MKEVIIYTFGKLRDLLTVESCIFSRTRKMKKVEDNTVETKVRTMSRIRRD